MTMFNIVPPQEAIADKNGIITPTWWRFFQQAFMLLGGYQASGSLTDALLLGYTDFKKSGADYDRAIADLKLILATLHPEGRIATVEKLLNDLKTLLYAQLWRQPIPAPVTPNFTMTLAMTQSLSSNVAAKVLLDTTSFDVGGFVDLTNHRYTPKKAGKYQFNCSAYLLSDTTASAAEVSLSKNGSTVETVDFSTTSLTNVIGKSALIPMNGTTDYIEVWVLLVGTGTLTVQNTFTNLSGFYVAP